MIAERLRGPHPALRLGLTSSSSNASQPVPPRRPPLPVGGGGAGPMPRRQPSPRSSLGVSRSEYILGCQEPLTVTWDIKEELSSTDWIGLYRLEESDPMRFLECINRRLSTTPKGSLPWLMECEDLFVEDVTSVCFKYYHGASGTLRAVSPVVSVKKSVDSHGPQNGQSLEEVIAGYSSRQYPSEMVRFYLSNLQAKNLKRRMFFTPSPYMKISVHPGKVEGALVLPHHGQQCRTGTAESTVHPSWPGRFEFIAYPSDSLEFEIKDKVAKNRPLISRFLGKLSIPVSQLLDQSTVGISIEMCYGLTSKNLSDNITGQLSFTFTRDCGPVDPWSHLRQVHNPIYVSDLPDAQSLPGTPQHPHPQLIARMPSLPNGSIPCPSARERKDRNPRQLTRQSVPNPAFTNLEYMLQNTADSVAACHLPQTSSSSDLPPPLPPKLKPIKGVHKLLERTKASSQDGESSREPQQAAKFRHPRPEDSFLLEIVDTDEQNEGQEQEEGPLDSEESGLPSSTTSLASFTDSSPPPALPQRTSSGAAQRPTILQMAQHGPAEQLPNGEGGEEGNGFSRTAPLATPEHDSIQDSVPSVENLSEAAIPEVAEEDGEEIQLEDSSFSDRPESYVAENNNSDLAGSPPSSSLSSQTLSASENEANAGFRGSDTESDDSTSPCDDEDADYSSLDVPHSDPAVCSPDSLSGAESNGLSSSMSVPNLFPTTTATDSTVESPSADVSERTLDSPTCEEEVLPSPSTDMPEIHITSCSPLPPCPPTPVHQPHPRNHLSSHETWDGHASSNSLSPSAHMPTTRLPSIPERTIRYQRVDLEEPLPSHWEARIDSHGRIFYIDHMNRTTTWTRPSAAQQFSLGVANEIQRQQLDRRYQSIRRTITSRATTSEDPSTVAVPSNSSPDNQRTIMLRSPAVRFITRPDFFNVVHMNDEAISTYNRSSSLKHMITKIRRDPGTFDRYQHNRDLVSLLNKFADTARDLPRGWETKLDRTGKQFFIDHTSRSTSFIDPRLPVETPYVNPHKLAVPLARRRSRSAGEEEIRLDGINRASQGSTPSPVPPPRPPSTAVAAPAPHVAAQVPTAYNDKVVAFLRQPNIMDILKERHVAVASNTALRDKINSIRADGTAALDRLSHDLDLTILLSLFEEEIMSYVPIPQATTSSTHRSPRGSPQPSPQASPGLQRANVRAPAPYRRDFEAKLRNFYRKLESKGYGQGPGKLKLNIRRDHLLEDAFTKIMAASKKDLQKSRLYISFAAEEGLDYGGPSREFFFLLSRELFNPYYGLFEYSANDTYTVQVSPMSAFVDNQHEWFRFSGRVLGLALVHQYLLDAFFTRPFYKALLRLPCSLSDLEYLDAEFHQSLLWLKENDISEMGLDLSFCVTEEVAGQIVEKELKPGGRNTPITERNKKEYIERMVKWRLERGVAEQTECLVKGFYEVVDPRLVSVFDARELELVIAGTAEIDTTDWRKNTEYRSGYHDNHPVIQWFWLAIEKFDNEQRLRLLQFVTGTSSIPYEGFSALRGSNGPRKFCIEKWGKPTSLPRAHTCFNRLDLPPYAAFDLLNEKLLLAVEESSTFGIE